MSLFLRTGLLVLWLQHNALLKHYAMTSIETYHLEPMAAMVISSCIEVSRAAALASHSAAGLVTSAKKVAGTDAAKLAEVARLLRTAESMARAATASLTGMAAIARTTAPEVGKGAEETGTSSATLTSSKKKRQKKNKKRDSDKEILPYVEGDARMDIDSAAAVVAPMASAPPRAAPSPSPEPAVLGGAQAASFFPAGSSIVISGLASRMDLNNVVGIVIATTTAADERVAIRLDSGEKIRVKLANVKPSIFPANFN